MKVSECRKPEHARLRIDETLAELASILGNGVMIISPEDKARKQIADSLAFPMMMNGNPPLLKDIYPNGHPELSKRKLREIYQKQRRMLSQYYNYQRHTGF